jgi:hypothetical protein
MIEDDLELAQIITDYLKSFDIEVTKQIVHIMDYLC